MFKFSRHKLIIISILLITVVINIALLVLNREQSRNISKLNDEWNSDVSHTIQTALELAKLEHALGYVGFIHHFKNYIIRREEGYFDLAESAYHRAVIAISLLKNRKLSGASMDDLKHIEYTLNEYYAKLQSAKINWNKLEPVTLDERVTVDDNKANLALIRLRKSLLPKVMEYYNKAKTNSALIESNSINSYLITLITLGSFAVFLVILLFKREYLLNQLRTILNSSPDGIIYSNSDGMIISANPAAHAIFQYQSKELLSKSIEDLIAPESRKHHQQYREDFTSEQQSRAMGSTTKAIKGIKKNGEVVELDVAISSVDINKEIHCISIIRDITNQKTLEAQAQKDYLTQLDNRRSIDIKLKDELVRAKRYGRCLSVILIDIDNFKQLNDTEGHLVGDKALKEVAHFLKTYSRSTDHIGRWGGDEFILLTPELNRADAVSLAERIRSEFLTMAETQNGEITLSLGVSSYCGSGSLKSIHEFFEEVDSALFSAKETGRDKVVSFDEVK